MSMPSVQQGPLWLVDAMVENRARTLAIADGFSDDDLVKVHEPTMGPAHWDLGHIAHFEEMWLLHGIEGEDARRRFDDPVWDAEKQPRPTRGGLAIPAREGLHAKLAESRERVLRRTRQLDLSPDQPHELLRDAFVHCMILMHEMQHQENMLITATMVAEGRYRPTFRVEKPAPASRPRGMVRVEGGAFPLGRPFAAGGYDNESPQHIVEVAPFDIDVAPVTNGDYLAFIDAGGYDQEDLWDEDGWLLVRALKYRHPKHWMKSDDGAWHRREFDRIVPLPLDEPVVHVSWYEADAYARWAGKRLPTEVEWEMAATWDPVTGTKHRHPWGDEPWTPERANLDQWLFGTAPIGSYPAGVSPVGCHQMLGDAWEWTSSVFTRYPGFRAFPYEEYSVPFFDRGFMVLRGGAWATRARVASGTFRNWHQPDHQQVFAGFRCARSA